MSKENSKILKILYHGRSQVLVVVNNSPKINFEIDIYLEGYQLVANPKKAFIFVS